MTVLERAARALVSAEFTVKQYGAEVRFEDPSVLGFAVEFATVEDLLQQWRGAEERFLRTNAAALRTDRRKSWNIYSVLLTAGQSSPELAKRLLAVEEDFRSTRKVARSGLATDRDVEDALLPLLPLRHRVSLQPEEALARVAERIQELPPEVVRALLRDASAEALARMLLAKGKE